VLAAIGKPESVPVLEGALLANDELHSWDAALGLARHPHPSASEALVRALQAANGEFTRIAAADVLGDPSHRAACTALLAQASDHDDEIRYHVLQAIGHAGCLTTKQWRARTRADPSADIRDLPRKLATQR
jgi:HEAT repeat protein